MNDRYPERKAAEEPKGFKVSVSGTTGHGWKVSRTHTAHGGTGLEAALAEAVSHLGRVPGAEEMHSFSVKVSRTR